MAIGGDVCEGFGIAVDFVEEHAVLAVRGEVDLLTAADFGAILDAVIDKGYRSVVLDLEAMSFMDASGLRVIAQAARRLGPSGDVMTLRSPSAMVRRILDITGLAEAVRIEGIGHTSSPLVGPARA